MSKVPDVFGVKPTLKTLRDWVLLGAGIGSHFLHTPIHKEKRFDVSGGSWEAKLYSNRWRPQGKAPRIPSGELELRTPPWGAVEEEDIPVFIKYKEESLGLGGIWESLDAGKALGWWDPLAQPGAADPSPIPAIPGGRERCRAESREQSTGRIKIVQTSSSAPRLGLRQHSQPGFLWKRAPRSSRFPAPARGAVGWLLAHGCSCIPRGSGRGCAFPGQDPPLPSAAAFPGIPAG